MIAVVDDGPVGRARRGADDHRSVVVGVGPGERDGAAISSPLASSARIAELQAEYLKGLYQLTEHFIKSALKPATRRL